MDVPFNKVETGVGHLALPGNACFEAGSTGAPSADKAPDGSAETGSTRSYTADRAINNRPVNLRLPDAYYDDYLSAKARRREYRNVRPAH